MRYFLQQEKVIILIFCPKRHDFSKTGLSINILRPASGSDLGCSWLVKKYFMYSLKFHLIFCLSYGKNVLKSDEPLFSAIT